MLRGFLKANDSLLEHAQSTEAEAAVNLLALLQIWIVAAAAPLRLREELIFSSDPTQNHYRPSALVPRGLQLSTEVDRTGGNLA